MSSSQIITRTALLLSLTLIFQSLRFFIPLPPFLSIFIIGSLVNASLLITTQMAGLLPALIIATVAPVVAYFQGQLLLPVFIFPVALGNAAYILLFVTGSQWWGRIPSVILATFGKTGLLYGLFTWLLAFIAIPSKLAASIMLAMSWPQLITGSLGGLVAYLAVKRIK